MKVRGLRLLSSASSVSPPHQDTMLKSTDATSRQSRIGYSRHPMRCAVFYILIIFITPAPYGEILGQRVVFFNDLHASLGDAQIIGFVSPTMKEDDFQPTDAEIILRIAIFIEKLTACAGDTSDDNVLEDGNIHVSKFRYSYYSSYRYWLRDWESTY